MTRPVQYFTKEYLERCKDLTTDQILEFLEDYRNLIAQTNEHYSTQRRKHIITDKIEQDMQDRPQRQDKQDG